MAEAQIITVKSVPIELCQLLKFAGLTSTGGEAKAVIAQGLVSVNGEIETRKRKKLEAGDTVIFDSRSIVVQVA